MAPRYIVVYFDPGAALHPGGPRRDPGSARRSAAQRTPVCYGPYDTREDAELAAEHLRHNVQLAEGSPRSSVDVLYLLPASQIQPVTLSP